VYLFHQRNAVTYCACALRGELHDARSLISRNGIGDKANNILRASGRTGGQHAMSSSA